MTLGAGSYYFVCGLNGKQVLSRLKVLKLSGGRLQGSNKPLINSLDLNPILAVYLFCCRRDQRNLSGDKHGGTAKAFAVGA